MNLEDFRKTLETPKPKKSPAPLASPYQRETSAALEDIAAILSAQQKNLDRHEAALWQVAGINGKQGEATPAEITMAGDPPGHVRRCASCWTFRPRKESFWKTRKTVGFPASTLLTRE